MKMSEKKTWKKNEEEQQQPPKMSTFGNSHADGPRTV